MSVIRAWWARSRRVGSVKPRSRRRGMSLVEVMVVIAIILTLMGILMLGVFRAYNNSKVQTTRLTMTKVNQEVELYILRKKKPPSTSDGLVEAYGGDPVPKDSWDHDFVYVSPGPDGQPYDLISLGSDGQEGGTGNAEDLKWSELRSE
jgi:general secretion pathway protein G